MYVVEELPHPLIGKEVYLFTPNGKKYETNKPNERILTANDLTSSMKDWWVLCFPILKTSEKVFSWSFFHSLSFYHVHISDLLTIYNPFLFKQKLTSRSQLVAGCVLVQDDFEAAKLLFKIYNKLKKKKSLHPSLSLNRLQSS